MLYNEYRPTKFSEMAGNEATIEDLQKREKNGTFPSVMMFVGESGTGKSTLANIVAATINCDNPIKTQKGMEPCGECDSCRDIFDKKYRRDVRFYDGSDLGKEALDGIRDVVNYEPMYDKKNVVIFDEAQNITQGGLEKVLTLLEFERPDTYFILCTMNPKAFNKAIQSRGQSYRFQKLSREVIGEYLLDALDEIDADEELPDDFFEDGLLAVAEHADGSLRQAFSHLERAINSKLYTRDDFERELGVVGETKTFAVLQRLLDYDPQFFIDIRDIEVRAFFNYGWKVLNETAIRSFNIENEDPDDWKVKNSKRLLKSPGFWGLVDVFRRINAEQGAYFNDNAVIGNLVQFFRDQKESKPPRLTEKEAPKKARRVVKR